MDLKMQRLNQGEKIATGSALALFVCMFLGWFNFDFATTNAWDSLHYISPLLAIAIAATLTIALLKASDKSLGDIPAGSVVFILGCVATALVLFRLLDPVSAGQASPFGGGDGPEPSSSAEAGLFLGLIAAAGIAVGGYLATGGRALDQVKTLFASQGSSVSPQPPPPPRVAPPAPPQPIPRAAQPAPPPPKPAPAVAVGERNAFCEHCGGQLQLGDRFCGACGQATSSG